MSNEVANTKSEPLSIYTQEGFELIQRQGKMYSQSKIVPKQYQNNVADCCIAVGMAIRMRADPFMVMQNLYIVHGNPTFSAKFMTASLNACGRFTDIRYRFTGTKGKDSWGCIAWAEDKTGEVLESTEVTIAMAKKEGWYDKNGSKWQTMPEQMLRYRSASFFARSYAPDVTMGMMTREEAWDIEEVADIEISPSPIEEVITETVNAEAVIEEKEPEQSTVDPYGLPDAAVLPAINTHKDKAHFKDIVARFDVEHAHHLEIDIQRQLLEVLLKHEEE